jgi:hypothetical protein
MAVAVRPRHGTATWSVVAAALSLLYLLPRTASAQGTSLDLTLRRTFGYSWGGDIQGSFLLIAEGSSELDQVTFYVDDGVLLTVSAPPFEARLHTGDYPVGDHRLWAEGALDDGSRLLSNEIRAEFVDPSAGWESAVSMLTPILIVVGLAIGGGAVFTAVSSRRFKPGVYGSSGGAICPRCRLPMSRHFLAPNLGLGKKLERCPHCGKWSRVPRATAGELAVAEARLLGELSPEVTPESEAEGLRRQVDDSRFVE